MRRRSKPMSVQQREEIRINSVRPECHSDMLTQVNRHCNRTYPCGTGPHAEIDCKGCHDFQSKFEKCH